MEGIIRIARTLDLNVIAEGIETEGQRDLLVSMGCQFGQGYLLAMPVEADQAEALGQASRRDDTSLTWCHGPFDGRA